MTETRESAIGVGVFTTSGRQSKGRFTMIRALTILAAVAALAVSTAPVASAGKSMKPRSGIVVTKHTDASSTSRASSGSGLTDVLISGWATKARSLNTFGGDDTL